MAGLEEDSPSGKGHKKKDAAGGNTGEVGSGETEPVRSFEEKMKRLEEIVRVMEQGDRPLEESMRLFEEGVALSDQCQKILEEAERKVSILLSASRDTGGGSVEAPFRRDS